MPVLLLITNYLDPDSFDKLIAAVPKVAYANKEKLLSIQKNKVPDFKLIQAALIVQYCHALRVSEVLNLTKENFDFKRNILTLEKTKTGFKTVNGIKKRKKQFTSIPPDFPKWVINYIESKNGLLFPFNRQLIWSYTKKAAIVADLQMGEQQEERYIEGAWTHLIRKSRAKLMIDLGAKEVLVKVKLRHTFTVTERYTKPDINGLIKWENENIREN